MLRRERLPTPVFLVFHGGLDFKESACNAEDLGSVPGLGKSPGGELGNPLHFSCLENPHGQRSLAGYNPWARKGSDMTEQLSTAHVEDIPSIPIFSFFILILIFFKCFFWCVSIDHLMQRVDSLEKTLMLGGIGAGGEGDDRG